MAALLNLLHHSDLQNYKQNLFTYLTDEFQVSRSRNIRNILKILQNNDKTTTTCIGFRDDDSYARRLKIVMSLWYETFLDTK